MTTENSKALQLVREHENVAGFSRTETWRTEAAIELLRQHARIAELEAQILKHTIQTHNEQCIRYGERYENPCDKDGRN